MLHIQIISAKFCPNSCWVKSFVQNVCEVGGPNNFFLHKMFVKLTPVVNFTNIYGQFLSLFPFAKKLEGQAISIKTARKMLLKMTRSKDQNFSKNQIMFFNVYRSKWRYECIASDSVIGSRCQRFIPDDGSNQGEKIATSVSRQVMPFVF